MRVRGIFHKSATPHPKRRGHSIPERIGLVLSIRYGIVEFNVPLDKV